MEEVEPVLESIAKKIGEEEFKVDEVVEEDLDLESIAGSTLVRQS